MLPPPMSSPKPSSIVVELTIAWKPYCASSAPVITRGSRAVRALIVFSSSPPFLR